MDLDDSISSVMEVVPFENTLRKIKKVIEGNQSVHRMISVDSVDMYQMIEEDRKMVETRRTTQVSTKYTTMDQR